MTDAERAARPPEKLASVLLGAASFLLFVAAFPERLYGDDLWFVYCILTDYPFTAHFLYLPLAKGLTWLGGHAGIDPLLSLRLFAAVGAAAGVGLFHAAALRAGASRAQAVLFAVLPVTAASTFFFATAAELHAVHLGAAGLLAWTLARLDGKSSPGRVFAVGLAFGLVVGTHKSGVLLFPGVALLYALATSGRTSSARWKDALAIAVAGALSIAAMLFFTWWQQRGSPSAGGLLAGSDSLDFYIQGFRGRLAQGFGWRDAAAYLSVDAAATAFGLMLVGAFGLGATLRQRPVLGAAIALLIVPYLFFFPIFNFYERGAYFVVLLPALAATALRTGLDSGRATSSPLAWGCVAAACVAALWRPDEVTATLGRVAPAALVGGLLVLGLLTRGGLGSSPRMRVALALLATFQLAGAWRTLAYFDREQPTLDWARGAAEEVDGAETIVMTYSFERTLVLMVLGVTWPAPYEGTWEFAEDLPRPTPKSFFYGDPTVSDADFQLQLRGHLASGTRIYVDDEVSAIATGHPTIGGRLEHVTEHYELTPVRREGFEARRVTLRP